MSLPLISSSSIPHTVLILVLLQEDWIGCYYSGTHSLFSFSSLGISLLNMERNPSFFIVLQVAPSTFISSFIIRDLGFAKQKPQCLRVLFSFQPYHSALLRQRATSVMFDKCKTRRENTGRKRLT